MSYNSERTTNVAKCKFETDSNLEIKRKLKVRKDKLEKPCKDPSYTRVAPEGKHSENQENALKDTMYTTISELDTTLQYNSWQQTHFAHLLRVLL